SVFEGYFQGYKTMKPTALAHTTGKFNRVTATIIFLELVRNLELKYRVAGIGIGLFVGELTALLILVYLFLLHHKNSIHSQKSNHQNRSSYREIIKELARFSLPITSGRLINSIIQSTKAVLIPFQLTKSGLPETKAAAVYGQLSGMAQQIIFLPSIITSSLTKSLIPALSEAYSRQNFRKIEKNYQDLIRIITYLGFPLTVIFNLYGPEICQLVYSHPEAGKILSHLSFSVTFIYYLQVSSGMLHGLGKPKLALRNLALGNLTQLIGIFLLVKFPALRIQGAVIAITGGSIGAALLNYLNLGQIIDFPKNISLLFYKPLLGSSIIYFINFIFRQYIYRQTGTIISGFNLIIILSVNLIIYIIFMFLCGAITRTDLKKIH
ncbi:MAG: polysaccharide biosynthesis C-terminal domain-containing protein, partial [Halanaerobiaceae bacterium]